MTFKDTKIYQIGKFLKDNPNKTFTNSDIAKNLKINPSTVSSSLSRLRNGQSVKVDKKINVKYVNKKGNTVKYSRTIKVNSLTKTGKIRKKSYTGFPMKKFKKSGKGNVYEKKEKVSGGFIGRFETWKVDFKLIETNSKNKNKNKWIDKMDLSAYAIGIVPFGTSDSKVVEVSGLKLFRTTLDKMQDENISLWNAVKENDSNSVYIGSELLSNETLDENYNAEWNGQITFVNNVGVVYHFPIKYFVGINEYD